MTPRYIVARLALSIPTLLGVALVVFLSLRLIPGDPAIIFAGDRATQEDIAALRTHLGLDRPLYVQLGLFVWHAAQGDLGRSIRSGQSVLEEVGQRLGNTLELAAAAIAVTFVFGIPLGIISAVRPGSLLDRASLLGSLVGVSAPAFVVGIILQLLFAVQFRWFPVAGTGDLGHLVLPALTLGLFPIANVARVMRVNLIEILSQDYVRTARAKGIAERLVLYRHALRNALITTVTILGLSFGYMLGGAILTEVVFAWPGLGRYLVQSIVSRDYPAVQGVVLVIAALYLALNLLVDMVYAALDPRIRYR